MKIPTDWIPLSQPWQEKRAADFQPSRMQLDWKKDALLVRVELTDSHIVSRATAHNQSLHFLGDTLEIFLKRPESQSYLELHVDPQNHRTALRWPPGGIERVRESTATPLENFRIDPECFGSRVEIFPTGWNVSVTIPPLLLGLAEWSVGSDLLASVCRYDFAESNGTPLLSTTSPHRVKNFHLWQDWRLFSLA